MKCHSRDIWLRGGSTVVTEHGGVGLMWSGCCLSSSQGPSFHMELETALPAACWDASHWGPSLAASQDQSTPRQLMLIRFTANVFFSWDKTLYPAQSNHCDLDIWLSCHGVHILTRKWECPSKSANTLESSFPSQHSHSYSFCLCELWPAPSTALLCQRWACHYISTGAATSAAVKRKWFWFNFFIGSFFKIVIILSMKSAIFILFCSYAIHWISYIHFSVKSM